MGPVMILALLACQPNIETQGLRGEGLGTAWTVRWVGDEESIPPVRDAVVAALDEVDQLMSTWKPNSEISRVRAAAGPVEVSEETASVIRASLTLAEATGGAFDPTVQPLVELWGFHGSPRTTMPTADEIAAAQAEVGWERVILGRTEAGHPSVDSGGTALDLSAIAKGHAVDRVSLALSRAGFASHFVEVGGEVRVAGQPPTAPHWRIGVEIPEATTTRDRFSAVLGLTNLATATSGNYRNNYIIGDISVSHTLDPRTGRPAQTQTASVTIVAPSCRSADGLATALMVLEPAEGLTLIEARPDTEALLVKADGSQLRSSGMARFIISE